MFVVHDFVYNEDDLLQVSTPEVNLLDFCVIYLQSPSHRQWCSINAVKGSWHKRGRVKNCSILGEKWLRPSTLTKSCGNNHNCNAGLQISCLWASTRTVVKINGRVQLLVMYSLRTVKSRCCLVIKGCHSGYRVQFLLWHGRVRHWSHQEWHPKRWS